MWTVILPSPSLTVHNFATLPLVDISSMAVMEKNDHFPQPAQMLLALTESNTFGTNFTFSRKNT